MSEETKDELLTQLDESALRSRHTTNVEAIAAIDAKEAISVEDARERRRLVAESNDIVTLVSEFTADDSNPAAELPTAPAPVETAPVADAPVADAPVADASVTTGIETFDASRVEELAAAIAAAASLQTAVNTRHEEVDAADVDATKPAPQTLVASAASTRNGVDSGQAIDLEQVGAIVQAIAFDRGNAGIHVPLVNMSPVVAGASAVSASSSRSENTRAFAEAITAAPFEVCGPADILRDVPDCNNANRYVPNWFRTVQSTHGEIEFYQSFGLADVAAGVNTWGQVEQDAITGVDTTWKDCVEIGCLPTAKIGVEAVTQCMCMPVFQVMTSPEAVASSISAIRSLTARVADGQLLDRYDAVSSKYTFDAQGTRFGASVQIYDLLGRLLGFAAAANREVDLSSYTLALEIGMLETLFLDERMRCDSDAMTAASELFAGLGIGNIVFTPDWSTTEGDGPWSAGLPINPAASAAVAVPARPTSFKARMFNGADFAMLSPGGDTLGIVPDFNNKRKNKVCWFGEIFQGLGKLGCRPAFSVEISNLVATGLRAACDVGNAPAIAT